jgi:putative ABC transport system permease protein
MNLTKIAWSNIRYKKWNTILSVVLLAFGVGTIAMMLLLERQLSQQFERNIKDIDFVLAAKGSPLQSILANVYHVDVPTGNIKVGDAKKIIRNTWVEEAIPLAYGDNYEKYRIVGTTAAYPALYQCQLAEGKSFEMPFEAVVGSLVARETGLKVGSTFTSMHGYDNLGDEGHHHDKPFTVVGIYAESGSVVDRLILTPVESTWLVHDHGADKKPKTPEPAVVNPMDESEPQSISPAKPDTAGQEEGISGEEVMRRMAQMGARPVMGGRPDPNDEKEMTAYLIRKRNRGAFGFLAKMTENTTMQLANVAVESNRLMNNFGVGLDTLKAIAYVISLISFLSIFISLYNGLKEREYELALLRTMGGTRWTLSRLILLEGFWIVIIGCAVGFFLSRIGTFLLSQLSQDTFRYPLQVWQVHWVDLVLFAVTLCIGILASLLPAWKAMKMDISKTLSHA